MELGHGAISAARRRQLKLKRENTHVTSTRELTTLKSLLDRT